ncbi:hypothetical protein AYL99_05650 [Fonsecaea erecta]|uniref:Uncharacterized protein n=1 Tax=Fonsecaea erecta TaxID=1367422 RepID=A0A178ZLH2_9EURO|nr:hypothetical protein AYL99_05650 [Fonsecaea erecta]OAP60648.1 hypothetical protein AYL99_05650 [Fonsecaea erecta]
MNGIQVDEFAANGASSSASASASGPGPTPAAAGPALLHRSLHARPYQVTAAKGLYLTLSDGRTIMDACGGAAVACLGHGNEEVLQAVARQMSTGVSYIHSLTYTTDSAEQLAHHLIDGPQGAGRFGLERAYFVNSGSEAMDAALKLARQYFFELGQTTPRGSRSHFVSRKQSYHGTTVGAMNVSSNLPRKVPYACFQLDNVSWVTPAYAYQYSDWRRGQSEEEFAQALVDELDAHFQAIGPEKVVAFIAEPLVGATSGCTPAPRGYFRGVRRVCDKYGVLLILDEVMSGMGRTGTLFAFEQEDVVPDLVTVGKGLGGGYAPVAGVLIHKKIVDVLRAGSSSFNHGHTYQAHPVGCAAALAVQQILRRDGLVENVARLHRVVYGLLVDALGPAKYVGDIRGRGLFWGIEFVRDKSSRESFAPHVGFGARFQALAFDLGVAVYPGSSTVDGTRGDHAILSPPYNVTEDELRKIVDVMKAAYDRLEKEVDGESWGDNDAAAAAAAGHGHAKPY